MNFRNAIWNWPKIMREQKEQIERDGKGIDELKNAIRDLTERQRAAHSLCQEFQEVAREAKSKLNALTEAHLQVAGQRAVALSELERLRADLETVGTDKRNLQLEKAKAEAELAKAQAQLERAELHLKSQKAELEEKQVILSATYEWIRESHHLDVPVQTPLRKLFSTLAKKAGAVYFLLLLPLMAAAQFPIQTPYAGAWSQTNVVSLSSSNATSKPLTNRHINGVTTLFGLEAAGSATVSMNGSNIVITGTAGGSGLSTNANQFGPGLQLTIKDGPLLTNVALFGVTTNMDVLQEPFIDATVELGSVSKSYLSTYIYGLNIRENTAGADFISIASPGLAATYTLLLPNAQGGNGQVITNDGAGGLGWWTPVTGGSGLTTNANQFGASVQLTIKSGAFQTNMNFWGSGTNHGDLWVDGSLFALTDNSFVLGDSGFAWFKVVCKGGGVLFEETGAGVDSVQIVAPPSLAFSYPLTLPDAQGANGQIITNDGSGNLGWWDAYFGGTNLYRFNANQFRNNDVTNVNVRAGALVTNTTHWTSNALTPALIVTNHPGTAVDVVQIGTTNGSYLYINSNGTTRIKGSTGATNDTFVLETTNGTASAYMRSNMTMVASNYAHSPFTATSGTSEQQVGYRLAVLTNNVTVTNTTAVTSLITNALWGSQIIRANTLKPGSTIKIWMNGFHTSASATACETGIRFNNNTLIATNRVALPTTLVNDMFVIDCEITCRSTGAAGTVLGTGRAWNQAASGAASSVAPKRMQLGLLQTTATIDTTVDQVVDVYVDPGATTHGYTVTYCLIEIVP